MRGAGVSLEMTLAICALGPQSSRLSSLYFSLLIVRKRANHRYLQCFHLSYRRSSPAIGTYQRSGGVTTTLIFSQQHELMLRDTEKLLWMVKTMTAVPKREVFERIIQNITSKFPDVYAALFISPEGFPINSWGVSLERAEEISALLSALIGKTKEIIKQVKQGGEMQFIQIQSTLGGIRIAPMEEFILVTMTRT